MSEHRDYFGLDASSLRKKRLFLLDMDGTIYSEESLFDGVLDFFEAVLDVDGRYVFITNNSSNSVEQYIEKVRRLGIQVDVDNFFTSTQATILYLENNYPGARVYCQGTRALLDELSAAGIDVVDEVCNDIQVALVGFDTELTSQKLRNTCQVLQRDIPYIATNPDLACPVSFGFIPDCGSICQILENATGRRPVYIGKPEPKMVDIVRNKFGYRRAETAVIGDRLYTDVAAGLNAGVTAICVLTGEATAAQIESSKIKPTFTFLSVKELAECIKPYMNK